ncbi:hypothetical protein FB567DRAFT_191699 [Paraphoma chrysanthemicola]|uniref:Uncharacterized protein n=1 Tax=Paraphoma chrysanthemicola TaxID=798071 RepID=A0A8K0QVR8_9PLEO|nr:hypothetical protein FB567DRAFT_191699 [Paraphoma chrysanthemicola]
MLGASFLSCRIWLSAAVKPQSRPLDVLILILRLFSIFLHALRRLDFTICKLKWLATLLLATIFAVFKVTAAQKVTIRDYELYAHRLPFILVVCTRWKMRALTKISVQRPRRGRHLSHLVVLCGQRCIGKLNALVFHYFPRKHITGISNLPSIMPVANPVLVFTLSSWRVYCFCRFADTLSPAAQTFCKTTHTSLLLQPEPARFQGQRKLLRGSSQMQPPRSAAMPPSAGCEAGGSCVHDSNLRCDYNICQHETPRTR